MAALAGTRGERAQLLLISALFLGVLLVVLAVVLNSAIYTGILATSGDTIRDGRAAMQYQHDVEQGVAGLVVHVNQHNDTSYEALRSNLSSGLDDWSELAERQFATEHTLANARLVSVTNGTRIAQDTPTRNFTNRTGETDWTLAESASAVRGYRMNVSQSALYETGADGCNTSGNCFYAEITNETATWRMYLYASNDTEIAVKVVNASGGSGICRTSAESVRIDVTEGTFAGDDCPPLSFAEGVSGPYDIRYVNADNVTGSYELVVDRNVGPDPDFDSDGSPSTSPAIYAADVSLTYRTGEVYYETEVRIVPGDEDG